MATVSVRWLTGGQVHTGGRDDLEVARSAADWVWVDVTDPDSEVLAWLGEAFQLHVLAVQNCFEPHHRPKVDEYGQSAFLVWITPIRSGQGDVSLREMDACMGGDHLITVHRGANPAVDDLASDPHDVMRAGPDLVLYGLIDREVDGVLSTVDAFTDELDEIENALLEEPRHATMERLYVLRRRLLELHRVIGPERDVLRALVRLRELIGEDAYRYFQDVGDHLARVEDSIETARDVASAAMDIYLSSVSNRMNEVMKLLTVVSTIFMPLTLISGIYGMNLTRGMWPSTQSGWSFAAVLAFMGVLAVWMAWFFKRRNWW